MAAGDHIARVEDIMQTASSPEFGSYIMTTPAPDVYLRSIDFDSASDESIVFLCTANNKYSGGSIKVHLKWHANSTSGVRWDISFLRMTSATLSSKDFDTVQSVSTTSGGANVYTLSEKTFTQAQADDLVAGDDFLLRVTRDQDHADDGIASDVRLVSVSFIEA